MKLKLWLLKRKLNIILKNTLLVDDVIFHLSEKGVAFENLHDGSQKIVIQFDESLDEKENLSRVHKALFRWLFTFSTYTQTVNANSSDPDVVLVNHVLLKYIRSSSTLITQQVDNGIKSVYKIITPIPIKALKYKLIHGNAQIILGRYCNLLYYIDPKVKKEVVGE